jgi:hypothetical protein
VDKQLVLEALESASDYEQGLSRLNDKQRGLVKKLYKAIEIFSKVVGKKQKHTSRVSLILCYQWLNLATQRPETHIE